MNRPRDGGPAYPFAPNEQQQLQDGTWDQNTVDGDPGRSLRDHYAGQLAASDSFVLRTIGACSLSAGAEVINKTVAKVLFSQAQAMVDEKYRMDDLDVELAVDGGGEEG
jgi:hypothetical protein